jgi:hypothetical protein
MTNKITTLTSQFFEKTISRFLIVDKKRGKSDCSSERLDERKNLPVEQKLRETLQIDLWINYKIVRNRFLLWSFFEPYLTVVQKAYGPP